MILTMVAMLSMTMAFAEGENATKVENVAAYDMSVNMKKLAVALQLTDDQIEAVADINHTFAAEMMFAAQYNSDVRKTRVNDAIEKDVKWMRYVLTFSKCHCHTQHCYHCQNHLFHLSFPFFSLLGACYVLS